MSQLTDLKFPTYSSKEGLASDSTLSVAASRKGGLWITSNIGLSYFDGRSAQNFTGSLALGNHYIKHAFEAANGDLYLVNGNKNLAVFYGGAIAKLQPCQLWPDALAEDAEGILVGLGPELHRFRDGQLQPYRFKKNHNPSSIGSITCLCPGTEPSGWPPATASFGCRAGIGNSGQLPTDCGQRRLPITEDEDGSIWAGSIAGIVRIKEHRADRRTETGPVRQPDLRAGSRRFAAHS